MIDWFMSLSKLDIGLYFSVLLIVMVLSGVRVAFAAAFTGFVGLVAIFSQKAGFEKGLLIAIQMIGTIPHSKITTHTLSLIPAFILIGYLAFYAGFTEKLFEAAKRWVGWLPGGLGIATVFSTAGFAAVSGSSVATSAVFARIAIPEMLKINYDKRFAAGVVAAGGTLASLIPPSAILVIYAIIVEQSVGHLLLAGFIPGVFSAIVYGLLIIILAKTNKKLGPVITGYNWKARFESLPGILPILAVVAIILSCSYLGWGTLTEAGSLGVFIVLIMALIQGMKVKQLGNTLLEAAKLTIMIFTIIWGVLIYVRFLGFAALPESFAGWISGLEQSPWITLILILCAYAILGMFMDAIGMLLLTLPVVYPAVIALNGGPGISAAESAFGMTENQCAIWFGILVVKMAELCLITPPIGLNCFAVAAVRPDISVQDVFRGASPFFIADIITIGILLSLPGIILWLPNLIGK